VPLHRRVVRFYDLPAESGVYVAGVEKDSPAAHAGLREGDIILGYGDQAVASVDDLHRLLTEEHVGLRSDITVLRGTERMSVAITPVLASH
jgi:S1-C subfamily serine protease